MPSRKEVQWSQLRVGALVLAAMAVLVFLIFLMSASSGGLFSPKLNLRTYFDNAGGLKSGAVVTLEGVTIGNVVAIRVVPERSPTPVEIDMRVGGKYVSDLHTDSTTAIVQAGVLGDAFVDISSAHASGPEPANNAELRSLPAPTLQGVISASQTSIDEITSLMRKTSILMDTLNSKKGTLGGLINDPAFYAKINRITDDLEKITTALNNGQGTAGKFLTDDTLYTRANSVIDRLDNVTAGLQEGKGTAGKLLNDDTLYNNLNATVSNANQLMGDINAGKGSLGKLAKDPAFAKKMDDTVTQLDNILTAVNEGKGTLGQLAQNRTLYDSADRTMDQAEQLLKGMRENPKKYFVIRLKLF